MNENLDEIVEEKSNYKEENIEEKEINIKNFLIIILFIMVFVAFLLQFFIKFKHFENFFENYNYKAFELNNGLKILILKSNTEIKNSYWGISINTGSINDSKFSGSTHILEHLIFRSNKKYNESYFNNILNKYSGNSNALTDFQQTIFYCNFNSKGFETILNIYLSYIFNSKLEFKKFNEEIQNVNSELNMRISEVNDFFIYDLMRKIIYKDSFLKKDGLKIYENINDKFKKELFNHTKFIYDKFYKINNASIIVITNENHDDIKNKIINSTKIFNEEAIPNYDTKDLSIIKKEYFSKIFFIKNTKNLNLLYVYFELDYDIYSGKNYIDFISLILKNKNKNSFYYNILYKYNLVNKMELENELYNKNKTVFKVKFTLSKSNENKYKDLLNYFYSFLNNLNNLELDKLYNKFYRITKKNNLNNISNKELIMDYVMKSKEDIIINYSKIISNPNFKFNLNKIKKFNKEFKKKFDLKDFNNFLKNNLILNRSVIILTLNKDSKINFNSNIINQSKFKTELNENIEFKILNSDIKNDTKYEYDIYNELKWNKNKDKLFIKCDKTNNFLEINNKTEGKKDCINKNIKENSNNLIPILYTKKKDYQIYYKKFIGYKNTLANLNIDIAFNDLIHNNLKLRDKIFFKLLKVYFKNLFSIKFFLNKFFGFDYKININYFSINFNINVNQNEIIDFLKYLFKYEVNNDIFNKSKELLINKILKENNNNYKYGQFIFKNLFEYQNNFNYYKNDKINPKIIKKIKNLKLIDFKKFLEKIKKNNFINLLLIGNFNENILEKINKNLNNIQFKSLNYNLNGLKLILNNYMKKNMNHRIKVNKLKNSKDNNKIFIKTYYINIKNPKEYLFSKLLESYINNELFDILRNKNNIGYVVQFYLDLKIYLNKFTILISGKNFDSKKHESLINEGIKNALKKLNKLKQIELNKIINNIKDKLYEIPNKINIFSKRIYKFNNYLNLFNIDEIKKINSIELNQLNNYANKYIIKNNKTIILELS